MIYQPEDILSEQSPANSSVQSPAATQAKPPAATQAQPPASQETTLSYSKEAASVKKDYMDDNKYSRVGDNLNFKLSVFYNIYYSSRLLLGAYIIIFLTILKRLT